MTLRQPLWWSVGLMSAGIAIGHMQPGTLYLPAACLILLLATAQHALHRGSGWLLLFFWFIFGAARTSMENTFSRQPSPLWEAIRAKTQIQNDILATRMQESGLQDDALSLAPALLLGRREQINPNTRQAYSTSGAAHLLALSGLHLGILYGLLHLLVIRRIRFSQWKWFALPPLLLLIWGYALLAGMPLSLVRAAVMCSAVMTAALARRALSAMHTLALSAWVILIISPSSLFSISFQLSFLAVFFILATHQQAANSKGMLPRLCQAASVSAAAWLGTAPLAAYYFHTLPLLSIPLSMLLVPLTTLIVYLSLGILLWPAAPLAKLLSLLASVQTCIVTWCAGLPGSVIGGLHPKPWHLLVVYTLLLLVLVRLNTYREKRVFLR